MREVYFANGPFVTQPPPPADGITSYGFAKPSVGTPAYLTGRLLPPMLYSSPLKSEELIGSAAVRSQFQYLTRASETSLYGGTSRW
jgi:hypothetical protein